MITLDVPLLIIRDLIPRRNDILGDNPSLVWGLESLIEEAESQGMRVSWIKMNLRAFGDFVDASITYTSTYVGSVVTCQLAANQKSIDDWIEP